MHVYFSDCVGHTAALALDALARLKLGFRPATLNAYTRIFRDFLAFLVSAGLHISQVNTVLVLAFMEFLSKNGSSPANISNYLAGIRALHIVYGLDTKASRDDRLPLFVKSLKINAPLSPKPLNLISVQLLEKIVKVCDKLKSPHIFKPLYLFAFFSFLRLSNILPHSARQFDLTRHLTRGDLIFTQNSCTVIIKWSKTLQNRKGFKTIAIPSLGASPLCPITSLQHMFTVIPASKNSPLFCLPSTAKHVALSDSTARKHLKQVSLLLDLPPLYTFWYLLGFCQWSTPARNYAPWYLVF